MYWLENRLIRSYENRVGTKLDYVRDILRSSRAAFWKFSLFMPLSGHRKHASAEALAVARIAAVKAEDCGPCLQINVDFALHEGVAPEVVEKAVLAPEALTRDFALIYRFAAAVAANTDEIELLRAALSDRLAPGIMTELAIAIASARVYPSLKRGLGHSKSCAAVNIDLAMAA